MAAGAVAGTVAAATGIVDTHAYTLQSSAGLPKSPVRRAPAAHTEQPRSSIYYILRRAAYAGPPILRQAISVAPGHLHCARPSLPTDPATLGVIACPKPHNKPSCLPQPEIALLLL
jgi:hypothetical protein